MSIMQRIAGAVHGPRIVRPAIAAAFAALCCLAGGLGAGGSVAVAQAAGACPNQALRTGASASLPDCRAWELVSPAEKGLVARAGTYLGAELAYRISSDGKHVFYPLTYGLPDATAGGPTRYVATRTAAGWTSAQLSPPALLPARFGTRPRTGKVQYLSPDLSCALVASTEPLASDAPQEMIAAGNQVLFRRGPNGSYTTITKAVPLNPGVITARPYIIHAATNGCRDAVFETKYTYQGIGASGLYEWSDGHIQNVGVLPDNSVASRAQAGIPGVAANGATHAVSSDLSHIFFSATSNAGGDSGKTAVFARVKSASGDSTIDVSQSETAVVDSGALFQVASTSGDRVLFLANYGIAASSTSSGPTNGHCSTPFSSISSLQPCDLYEYDFATGALTDLSADSNPADTDGAVVAGVLGASDDGSWVYFAAQGQLLPGKGSTYAQNTAHNTVNIYLAHAGGLAFVGLLKGVDLTGEPSGALLRRTSGGRHLIWYSRVTPDGRHLLFTSSADVTGYDSGGVAEAYLYSYSDGSGDVVCVSCRPDGDPSVGVPAASSEPTAPLSPQLATPSVPVARPVRSLTANGERVFFTMPDALAHGAVSGATNIYEWENGTVHLILTGQGFANDVSHPDPAFVGATASGDDVLISTNHRLVSGDRDLRIDLYDARVNGGFPAAAAPTAPCAGTQCQGAPSPVPAGAAPATTVFRGPGNVHPASSAAVFHVRGIGRRKRRRLAAGKRIGLVVRISEPGRVRASVRARLRRHGKVRAVAHDSKRAGRAGSVRVHLRLSRHARRHLRHHRLRIAIRVRYSRVQGTQRARLTLRRSRAHSSTHRRHARHAHRHGNRSRGARR